MDAEDYVSAKELITWMSNDDLNKCKMFQDAGSKKKLDALRGTLEAQVKQHGLNNKIMRFYELLLSLVRYFYFLSLWFVCCCR